MSDAKLINGDCIEEMQKLIDKDIKVDLILTDLPYGTTTCKWDSIIPLDKMWECIEKIVSDKTPILFFAQQPFTSRLVSSNYDYYKHEWIYQKKGGTNFTVFRYAPAKVHESVLVFCKTSPYYYPIKEPKAESTISRDKYDFNPPSTSIEYNSVKKRKAVKGNTRDNLKYPITVRQINNLKPSDRGLHPTQKPVELLEYLIKTYSNENDTVLDFTMGSGSTGVACVETNRNFIGIELDKKYYDIAKQRISEAKAQRRLI